MTRPTLLLGLAIGAATIVAACSTGAAPSGSPSAPPATVDGKTFVSTDIQGGVLVPGTRIQLTFNNGDLNASGGCNSMGGQYTIQGGRLTTGQMFMTEMACDEPRMQQDDWLSKFLAGATIALAGDTLTLTDDRITLTLLDREVAEPDKPLQGTRWVLDAIMSGDAVSSVPAGVTASIRFVENRVEVEAGCNTGGGAVTVTADMLTFGAIGLTKKGCEQGPMAVEQAMLKTLSGPAAYFIQGDVLFLDTDGAGLTFRAAP